MSTYNNEYTKPYPNGFEDKPSRNTSITASILNTIVDTIIKIESWLHDHDILNIQANPSTSGVLVNDLENIEIEDVVYKFTPNLKDCKDVTFVTEAQYESLNPPLEDVFYFVIPNTPPVGGNS